MVIKAEDESMYQHYHHHQGRKLKSLTKPPRRLLQFRPGAEFESNAAIDGGPFNVWAVSEGQPLQLDTEKLQNLNPSLWNLDRLDQKNPPLDGKYHYGSPGKRGIGQGVNIYILDSGIMADHREFYNASANPVAPLNGGNVSASTAAGSGAPSLTTYPSRVTCGYNFVNMTTDCTDTDGHGSHVAGVAGGLQVGVAKAVSLIAVKILDSQGLGTVSGTVAALNYVAAVHNKPAVVTLSLGVKRGDYSRALEDAVRSLIENHGVTVVVASGNLQGNSCDFSPAATPQAITVAGSGLTPRVLAASSANTLTNDIENSPSPKTEAGSTNGGSSTISSGAGSGVQSSVQGPSNFVDGVYVLGNQGACVDLFAPGVDIWSVCGGARRCGPNMSTSSYAYASGTSMAVPHVAGAAALYLENRPEATPAEVAAALKTAATEGAITGSVLMAGTPNLLLRVNNNIADETMKVHSTQGSSTSGK